MNHSYLNFIHHFLNRIHKHFKWDWVDLNFDVNMQECSFNIFKGFCLFWVINFPAIFSKKTIIVFSRWIINEGKVVLKCPTSWKLNFFLFKRHLFSSQYQKNLQWTELDPKSIPVNYIIIYLIWYYKILHV